VLRHSRHGILSDKQALSKTSSRATPPSAGGRDHAPPARGAERRGLRLRRASGRDRRAHRLDGDRGALGHELLLGLHRPADRQVPPPGVHDALLRPGRANQLWDHLEDRLGITQGEVTPDGSSASPGSSASAPAARRRCSSWATRATSSASPGGGPTPCSRSSAARRRLRAENDVPPPVFVAHPGRCRPGGRRRPARRLEPRRYPVTQVKDAPDKPAPSPRASTRASGPASTSTSASPGAGPSTTPSATAPTRAPAGPSP
jgi:hypothetical protein